MCCNVTGGGVDYNSGPYNVTFPIGSTIVLFDVVINDDGILEGTETFTLVISQFTNNNTVGTRSEATVHIMNINSKFLYAHMYTSPLNSKFMYLAVDSCNII